LLSGRDGAGSDACQRRSAGFLPQPARIARTPPNPAENRRFAVSRKGWKSLPASLLVGRPAGTTGFEIVA
jgi:hypothetical protein